MNITLLSVAITTQPKKTSGTYQVADVAYKNNSFQGKVEGKKIFSFGATEQAFKALAVAQPGESYDVDVVKNNAGYNDWVKMTKAGAEQVVAKTAESKQGSTPAVRSTYETPEERARKQVSIVRQSSLGHAVATLSVGAKSVKSADVIATAKEYEAYVHGSEYNGGATGFDDIPDLDPEFTKPSVL